MAWKSGQSYSTDLRSRVLAAIDGGGSATATAQLFQVSVSYIYKALARREATGETEARPQRNRQTLGEQRLRSFPELGAGVFRHGDNRRCTRGDRSPATTRFGHGAASTGSSAP